MCETVPTRPSPIVLQLPSVINQIALGPENCHKMQRGESWGSGCACGASVGSFDDKDDDDEDEDDDDDE